MELDGLFGEQNTMQRTGFEILNHAELLFELFKNVATLYISGDIQLKREILGIVCSNFYYDGQEVIIAIKKAFQPLVKIAYLLNLGRSGLEPPTSPLSGTPCIFTEYLFSLLCLHSNTFCNFSQTTQNYTKLYTITQILHKEF